MTTESKSFRPILKALDDKGSFVAVFATFQTVDHHGDVTLPGAFRDGQEVLVGAYQHEMSRLPVGKGTIRTDDREARIEGRFFVDTTHGLDTYRTVKNAGPLLEWSYVLQVVRSRRGEFHEGEKRHQVRFLEEVDVWSVDPVLKGAGINTRTVTVKSRADDRPEIDLSKERLKFERALARGLGLLS